MATQRIIPDRCRACKAPIAWVFSKHKPKPYPSVPVNWDTLHAAVQQAIRDGQKVEYDLGMVSHFQTCPDANRFSKNKKKAGPAKPPSNLPFE